MMTEGRGNTSVQYVGINSKRYIGYESRREKACPRFLTRSDTNLAVQTQKMARGLKFQI